MLNYGILAKNVAFDKNHSFRDFCVSMVFYCPYTWMPGQHIRCWDEC